MNVEDRLKKLEQRAERAEKEVRRLQRKVNQPVRQHATQSKQFDFLKRTPADINVSELGNREVKIFRDDKNDASGIIFQMDGKKVTIDGTVS